ncbi:phosphoserine phosphatase [Cordyceps fumosorosea ARSEF 2679]|uniref:phosphoserine phosphatase n=1 Tax=Cordyceps fumosorosea (strain ARSEF 2679) TaxID=1081104 RepID=A0A167TKJ0_CORFA|nr:phosphoserine phosphatase [Cordyceps fumosorosea ARSEF 2679]OAA60695.1 phosphoserine phosphatase [Cordyceps fumosorosea ARSEF 2679]
MAEPTSPQKPATARPQLTSAMRSSSYLSDHQQYRRASPRVPDVAAHHGIDTVLESSKGPGRPSVTALPFRGVPSDDAPPTIVESGIDHTYAHHNCAPPAGRQTDRLVVTLFYKGSRNNATEGQATCTNTATAAPLDGSTDSLPANMAPTASLDAFPLEPPTQEPEHLDHLYGSYVSPLCIASFLHLMSGFPLPDNGDGADEPHSAHRCLDDPDAPRVVELTLTPAPSPDFLSVAELRRHEALYRFEREWNVDVVLRRDAVWRRHPRLVAFDMDSTLIRQEVIDLLADHVPEGGDLAERVADITRRAMAGELEFEESFRARLRLLHGLPASVFERLRPALQVTTGVPQLLRALKRLGVKTAVLSGGFQPLTAWLAGELGIDYAYANEVEVGADGKLTGEAKGVIVGKERKRDLLVEIAAKENIDLSQVVAVGDGANDLLMLDKAGLGVAWNAKPRVQMEAAARLNGESLLDLLYLFGFTAEEINALTS